MQTRLGGGHTQLSGGLQHRVGAGGACKPGEGIEDAKLGRGMQGGRREGQSAPRPRELHSGGRRLSSRKVGGAVKSHGGGWGGGCKPTKVLAPGRSAQCGAALEVGMPAPGRAGPSRQGRLCRERVGGITGGLAQPRRVCPCGRPRAPCGGRTLAGGWGPHLPCQHLEQLEVLHAYLLLVPRQVGCGHRGQMNPASA